MSEYGDFLPPGFHRVNTGKATSLMEASMLALEAEFHREGWDSLPLPRIFVLAPPGEELSEEMPPAPPGHEALVLISVPIPEPIWVLSASPAAAIRSVAQLIALPESTEINRQTRPVGIRAIMFISEAWSVTTRVTEKDADDLPRYLAENRLDEHPLAVECRIVEAIGVDGTRVVVSRDRGADEPVIIRDVDPRGEVTPALKLLLDVVTQ